MQTAIPHRVGIYLGVVQFLFTTTWTVYVIYLPALAAQVGIGKQAVTYILLADQVVFMVADFAMGVAADRVSRVLGRLARFMLGITLVSCVAFLVLPQVATPAWSWLFATAIVLWLATSSVLRAPPLVLLGKYAAKPAKPWLAALSLFGLGVAGAVAPYLTGALRNVDPRLPFALASLALALATGGILWAERSLAGQAPPTAASSGDTAVPKRPIFWFLFGVILLGLGYQVHVSLNSAALYLRFAKPADLEMLLPIFWIGFSLLMLPASWATKRWGGIAVMGVGGVVGALAILVASNAGSLYTMIAAQFIAGGAWGCVLMSAIAAALMLGHTGREGKVTGALFALLALAACARFAMVAARLKQDPQFAVWLTWGPTVAWVLAGVALLALVTMRKDVRTTA